MFANVQIKVIYWFVHMHGMHVSLVNTIIRPIYL